MARILVADDNPQVTRLISFKLEQVGHEVLVVEDGVAAVDRSDDFQPDLCILDVMMPGLDGYQVLAALRSRPGLEALPVILLTSLGGADEVVRGLRDGADDYVVKPFSPSEILARVDRLLAA